MVKTNTPLLLSLAHLIHPSPYISTRRGIRSVLSFPLVLHEGVVSRKYGTPYLCGEGEGEGEVRYIESISECRKWRMFA